MPRVDLELIEGVENIVGYTGDFAEALRWFDATLRQRSRVRQAKPVEHWGTRCPECGATRCSC